MCNSHNFFTIISHILTYQTKVQTTHLYFMDFLENSITSIKIKKKKKKKRILTTFEVIFSCFINEEYDLKKRQLEIKFPYGNFIIKCTC